MPAEKRPSIVVVLTVFVSPFSCHSEMPKITFILLSSDVILPRLCFEFSTLNIFRIPKLSHFSKVGPPGSERKLIDGECLVAVSV